MKPIYKSLLWTLRDIFFVVGGLGAFFAFIAGLLWIGDTYGVATAWCVLGGLVSSLIVGNVWVHHYDVITSAHRREKYINAFRRVNKAALEQEINKGGSL